VNNRLAKVLELEAVDLERINPASARAVRSHLLKYMSEPDYNAMWAAQDGLCAICRLECSKSLAVDHDHKTGKIRGLLCKKCNMALGLLKDDIQLMSRAIEYLTSNNDSEC